jgi:hypothetical protein
MAFEEMVAALSEKAFAQRGSVDDKIRWEKREAVETRRQQLQT